MAKTNIEELEIGQLLSIRLLIEKKKKEYHIACLFKQKFYITLSVQKREGEKKKYMIGKWEKRKGNRKKKQELNNGPQWQWAGENR